MIIEAAEPVFKAERLTVPNHFDCWHRYAQAIFLLAIDPVASVKYKKIDVEFDREISTQWQKQIEQEVNHRVKGYIYRSK